MINLADETIEIPGREPSKIKSTTVWWLGPLGLVPGMKMVKEQAELLGLDFNTIPFHFTPVPIALGEDGCYEQLR